MKTSKKITMLMAVVIFTVGAAFASVNAINASSPVSRVIDNCYRTIFCEICLEPLEPLGQGRWRCPACGWEIL